MKTLPESDLRFLATFEACELSETDFRHREHVRLAYIYLSLHPFEVAYEKIEKGLRRLLAHLGAPPDTYHETLTRAWLLAVQHFMQSAEPTRGPEQFLEKSAALLDKEIMKTHYTSALLSSDEACRHFVGPDLEPIPDRPC